MTDFQSEEEAAEALSKAGRDYARYQVKKITETLTPSQAEYLKVVSGYQNALAEVERLTLENEKLTRNNRDLVRVLIRRHDNPASVESGH